MDDIKIAYVTLQYTPDAPALGLAYIATYLRKYGNFNQQKIIDVKGEYRIKETLNYHPDVVLVSAKTMHYPQAVAFAKELKQKIKIPIIIGGAHISTMPTSLDPIFDIGVVGEGEETTLEIMRYFRKNRDLDNIRHIHGLVFYSNKELIRTQDRPLIEPLDRIPIPDRSFFDKRYFTQKNIIHTNKAKRLTGIITSRGCPYKCIFCATSLLWKKVRMHSAKRIADEIEYLIKDYSIEAFFIYDDLFTINKARLKELIEILKQRNLLGKFSFNCMGRSNNIDEEILDLLKTLNVDYINFGFESGSNRVLRLLKGEQISVEDHKKAILLCKKKGINVQGSLMFGNPTETREDLQGTLDLLDFMYNNGVNLAWATVTKPLPGTQLWDDAIKKGQITEGIDLQKLSVMEVDPLVKSNNLSIEEFNEAWKAGMKKIRKMEIRFWIKKFLKDPVHVIMFASRFRVLKFFKLERNEE